MSKAPDATQTERLRRLATLPDDRIDTADLPVVEDWSRGVRGGTPSEVRRKVAAMEARRAPEPKARGGRAQVVSREATHAKTAQRTWYRYEFKVGSIIRHYGITQDPREREIEHQQLWPTGKVVILGAPMSARAAREWDLVKDRDLPFHRVRKSV